MRAASEGSLSLLGARELNVEWTQRGGVSRREYMRRQGRGKGPGGILEGCIRRVFYFREVGGGEGAVADWRRM